MSCDFAHSDAAYVLGALAPADRLAFERHLAGCAECTRAVRELAGLPGLLGRVDASILEHPPADEPVPETLLPALSREVRRAQRRRLLTAAGTAAAAAAAVVAVSVPVVLSETGGAEEPPPGPGTSSVAPDAVARAMRPVGEVPVRADVVMEQMPWGTRLGLVCTYDPAAVEYELPPEVDYTLFVRTRDGRVHQVGSWRSIGGRTMQLEAATAASPEDIESVEVRTTSGRVVLRLTA